MAGPLKNEEILILLWIVADLVYPRRRSIGQPDHAERFVAVFSPYGGYTKK